MTAVLSAGIHPNRPNKEPFQFIPDPQQQQGKKDSATSPNGFGMESDGIEGTMSLQIQKSVYNARTGGGAKFAATKLLFS